MTSVAPAPTAFPASHSSKSGRNVVHPLYGAAPHRSERTSTVMLCDSVSTMVARRVTQRCTGTSSHHRGTRSSSTRP